MKVIWFPFWGRKDRVGFFSFTFSFSVIAALNEDD